MGRHCNPIFTMDDVNAAEAVPNQFASEINNNIRNRDNDGIATIPAAGPMPARLAIIIEGEMAGLRWIFNRQQRVPVQCGAEIHKFDPSSAESRVHYCQLYETLSI